MNIDIIFENNEFVAVNKPSGLLSIPDRMGKEISLKDLLKDLYTHNRDHTDLKVLLVQASWLLRPIKKRRMIQEGVQTVFYTNTENMVSIP